jgi:hypothetical protein
MQNHAIVRSAWLTALGAAVVAGSFVALGLQPDKIPNYFRGPLTPAGFALWFSAFVIATLTPPVIALACSFASERSHYGWLSHFLIVPTTHVVVRASVAIMLLAASKPNSDGPTGSATDPPLCPC